MKNKLLKLSLILAATLILSACGDKTNQETVAPENVPTTETATESVTETEPTPEITEAVAPKVEEKKDDETEGQAAETAEDDSKEDEETAEADFMKDVKEINPSVKLYAMKDCNVRKGPSTDYDVVGHLKLNDEIEVIGQDKGGWYEFKQGEEVVFVSDSLVSDTPIDPVAAQAALEALIASQAGNAASANAAAPQAPAAQAPAANTPVAQAAAPVVVTAPAGVLFIGDSRCVQMREALAGGGCSWICRNGARYEWFAETAIPQADTMVGKGTKVIICMGVNDPGDASRYAALANAKAFEWAQRGAKTYYVSVNPVWENPYTSEDQVRAFNASIVGQLMGIKWIDTHTYLEGAGYRLVDGLHYDGETYFKIFSAIMAGL